MNTTINFFFYDQHRKLSIGDTVTVAQVKYGETRGERAKLEKITARYAEFVTTSGSRVKVYAQGTALGRWYLGHRLPTGWEKDGWFIDTDPEREIIEKHPEYLAFVKKTGDFEWRDR